MTAANIKKYAATNGGKLFEQSAIGGAGASASGSDGASAGGSVSPIRRERQRSASESVWTAWINTIYDVIVFLTASLGFILQVRVIFVL